MAAQLTLLHLLVLFTVAALVSHRASALVGSYTPIRDVGDPYVQEIAKFAVAEYNERAGKALVYVRVVSGAEQVVAGTNYKLIVEAADGGAKNHCYEAVVYEREWEKLRELVSFVPYTSQSNRA